VASFLPLLFRFRLNKGGFVMQSRPVVFGTLLAAIALYVATRFDIRIDARLLAALLGVCLLATAFLLSRPRWTTPFVGLSCLCVALLFLAGYDAAFVKPIRACHGKLLSITATLRTDPVIYETNQRVQLRIDPRITPVAKVKHPFRVYCYLPLTDEPLLAGDTVQLKVKFTIASDSGGFDREAYQASNGCFIAATYAKDSDGNPLAFSYSTEGRDKLTTLPVRIGRAFQENIATLYPAQEGGLLRALLLGDRTGLDPMDYAALRKAGMSHLVAVSGLHVGFLVSLCYLLFGKRIGTVASLLTIALFIPIAGMTPSVIRAGVMYAIAAGGFLLRKEADSLNSLFLALLLLLLQNPYAVQSTGLQLSFAATLGLLVFSGPMQQRLQSLLSKKTPRLLKTVYRAFAGAVACSVCAMLLTAPFLFSSFGYVSILSLVSNVLVVSVTALCFVGGLLSCLLYRILPPVAQLLAWIVSPLLRYIQGVADTVSRLPFGVIHWENAFGIAALALFFLAVLVWLFGPKEPSARISLHLSRGAIAALCGGVVVCSAIGMYRERTRYTITVLPCGDGEAILLSAVGGETALIDCGSSSYQSATESIQEWMLWNCFDQIDTLILTAVDKTHARDLPTFLDTIPVTLIYIPDGCTATQHNTELLRLLAITPVPVQTVTDHVPCAETLPLTVFPITDGKLGVSIGSGPDTWTVLHSPTQKQLAAYLQEQPCSAPTVVLSGRQIADWDLLHNAVSALQTTQIVLQAGGESIENFEGIPIVSTYDKGQLVYSYPLDSSHSPAPPPETKEVTPWQHPTPDQQPSPKPNPKRRTPVRRN